MEAVSVSNHPKEENEVICCEVVHGKCKYCQGTYGEYVDYKGKFLTNFSKCICDM